MTFDIPLMACVGTFRGYSLEFTVHFYGVIGNRSFETYTLWLVGFLWTREMFGVY